MVKAGRTPARHGHRRHLVDGAFWFESGELTRKGNKLVRDPCRTLSLATHYFDLVVEGQAHKVTDPTTVAAWQRDGRWTAGPSVSTTPIMNALSPGP